MKKPESKSNDFGVVESATVDHVRSTKAGVFFSLTLNGVTINNCRVVEGKKGDFISLPSYKGSDDNYYSYVWFKFSNEDQATIIHMVEEALN